MRMCCRPWRRCRGVSAEAAADGDAHAGGDGEAVAGGAAGLWCRGLLWERRSQAVALPPGAIVIAGNAPCAAVYLSRSTAVPPCGLRLQMRAAWSGPGRIQAAPAWTSRASGHLCMCVRRRRGWTPPTPVAGREDRWRCGRRLARSAPVSGSCAAAIAAWGRC